MVTENSIILNDNGTITVVTDGKQSFNGTLEEMNLFEPGSLKEFVLVLKTVINNAEEILC